ncbi:MAG: signal peptidase I [Planctomycetota bacterium]|jgi:signal peptidase I
MSREKAKKFICRLWREYRLTIFFIIFVVIPAKSSLADWNWVPTGSMNPTILEGELIYVDKLAYDLRFPLTLRRLAKWSDPQRGDIVICFSPEDGTRLVKRVAGQPGDTIELKNNRLFLNGLPLSYAPVDPRYTKYLSPRQKRTSVLATEDLNGISHAVMSTPAVPARRNFGPLTVPEGHYFVLGDNRDNSKDSRFFGLVKRQAIVGKARGIILSFDITDKYQPRFERFLDSLE